MTLLWERLNSFNDAFSISEEVLAITPPFAVGNALRRTVADLSLVFHNVSSDAVDDIIAFGCQFAVVVTTGVPPGRPSPGCGEPSNREDIIHIEHQPGRLIQGENDAIKYVGVPGDGRAFHCDTPAQRLARDTPMQVWVYWKLCIPSAGTASFNVRRWVSINTLIDFAD